MARHLRQEAFAEYLCRCAKDGAQPALKPRAVAPIVIRNLHGSGAGPVCLHHAVQGHDRAVCGKIPEVPARHIAQHFAVPEHNLDAPAGYVGAEIDKEMRQGGIGDADAPLHETGCRRRVVAHVHAIGNVIHNPDAAIDARPGDSDSEAGERRRHATGPRAGNANPQGHMPCAAHIRRWWAGPEIGDFHEQGVQLVRHGFDFRIGLSGVVFQRLDSCMVGCYNSFMRCGTRLERGNFSLQGLGVQGRHRGVRFQGRDASPQRGSLSL